MTDIRLYIATHLIDGSIRQIPKAYDDFDDNYFVLGCNVGLRIPLFAELSNYEGQLENEFIFNYAGGNEKNLGSHRFQFGWMTGWKQNFFDVPYARAMIGIGVNDNWLNFGQGAPLENEFNVSFITQFELGIDLCSKKRAFCVSPSIGFRYEIAMMSPHYESLGLIGAISVSGSFNTVDKGVYNKDLDTLKAENERLLQEAKQAQREKEYAESQWLMIGRMNEELTKKNKQLKESLTAKEPTYLNTVIVLTPEADNDPDHDLQNGEYDGSMIHEKLDYLAVQLKEKSLKILLHGHSVRSSDSLHDQIQSYKYAKAVRNYLISQGVSPDSIILDATLFSANGTETINEDEAIKVKGKSIHGSSAVVKPDKMCEKQRCVAFEVLFKNPD